MAGFQDDFDLDKNGGQPKNHFVSVGKAVQAKYPEVEFSCEPFPKGKGKDKVARMEELIRQKKPVLVSLSNEPLGGPGWHIMPVVDETADEFTLLEYVDPNGKAHTKPIKKAEVAGFTTTMPAATRSPTSRTRRLSLLLEVDRRLAASAPACPT